MFNIDIRDAMKGARVYGYEVARSMGIHEASFSRIISRRECSDAEKLRILEAIKNLREENKWVNG